MEFVFCITFCACFCSILGADIFHIPKRDKRQASLWCSDTSQAVSRSRNGVCGMGYRYDPLTQYCCVQQTATMPVCPNGVAAAAICVGSMRSCGSGYTCTRVTSSGSTMDVCCSTGTTVIGNTCVSPNQILGPCIGGTLCPTNSRCITINNGQSCCGPAQRTPVGK